MTQISTSPGPAWAKAAGFTLLELLAVCAIMVMMAGLVVPAVSSYGKANALKAAGNKISGMLDLARQEAMSKGAMTALVLLTEGEEKYRALTVLKISPKADGSAIGSGDWEQISKWEKLPPGIVAEEESLDASSVAVLPPFPATELKFQGAAVLPSKYVVFLPNGSVYRTAEPSKIRLVEGVWSGGGAVHTRRDDGGKPSNHYDVFVLPATGQVKTDSP